MNPRKAAANWARQENAGERAKAVAIFGIICGR